MKTQSSKYIDVEASVIWNRINKEFEESNWGIKICDNSSFKEYLDVNFRGEKGYKAIFIKGFFRILIKSGSQGWEEVLDRIVIKYKNATLERLWEIINKKCLIDIKENPFKGFTSFDCINGDKSDLRFKYLGDFCIRLLKDKFEDWVNTIENWKPDIKDVLNKRLVSACQSKDLESVKLWVEQGADDFDSGAACSASGGGIELLKYLFDIGAKDYNRCMEAAVKSGTISVFDFLISKGVKIEDFKDMGSKHSRLEINHRLISGMSLSYRASKGLALNKVTSGLSEVSKYLYKGCDYIEDVFEFACSCGQLEIAKFCLEEYKVSNLNSAAVKACKSGSIVIAKYLLEQGADNFEEMKLECDSREKMFEIKEILSKKILEKRKKIEEEKGKNIDVSFLPKLEDRLISSNRVYSDDYFQKLSIKEKSFDGMLSISEISKLSQILVLLESKAKQTKCTERIILNRRIKEFSIHLGTRFLPIVALGLRRIFECLLVPGSEYKPMSTQIGHLNCHIEIRLFLKMVNYSVHWGERNISQDLISIFEVSIGAYFREVWNEDWFRQQKVQISKETWQQIGSDKYEGEVNIEEVKELNTKLNEQSRIEMILSLINSGDLTTLSGLTDLTNSEQKFITEQTEKLKPDMRLKFALAGGFLGRLKKYVIKSADISTLKFLVEEGIEFNRKEIKDMKLHMDLRFSSQCRQVFKPKPVPNKKDLSVGLTKKEDLGIRAFCEVDKSMINKILIQIATCRNFELCYELDLTEDQFLELVKTCEKFRENLPDFIKYYPFDGSKLREIIRGRGHFDIIYQLKRRKSKVKSDDIKLIKAVSKNDLDGVVAMSDRNCNSVNYCKKIAKNLGYEEIYHVLCEFN